jgi:hypothetical protein
LDKKKLLKYFYSNVATIFWSCFLLIGGGIFVAYYWQIEYMPDFDLKSAATITAAAGVTALIITIMMLFMMVAPGVYWGNSWGKESKLKYLWTDNDGTNKFVGVLIWFGLPLLAVGVVAVALVTYWWLLIMPGIVFIIYYLYLMGISNHFNNDEISVKKEFWSLVSTAIVDFVFIFPPIFFVSLLASQSNASHQMPVWLSAGVSVVIIACVNVIATWVPKNFKPFSWYLILGFIAFFIILSVFEKGYVLPQKIMERYKFGNIKTNEIVLKKDACDVINALGIGDKAIAKDKKNDSGLCVAQNLKILSRLGKEAYLQYGPDTQYVRFTIEAADIKSWSVKKTQDEKKSGDTNQ